VLVSPGGGDERISLPVASVLDTRQPKQPQIRVYYSNWPLSQRHLVRAPLLEAGDVALPEDFVGAYHKALRAGALTAIVETFEPDGVAREPAGGAHAYRGAKWLTRFYAHLCGEDIGIVLEYCSLFDDGTRCVLEYNCVNWAGTPIPPQAGVAVYERGSSGRLAAARIYDDVDPPAPPGPTR
jgi:SnoaL-like domain